MSDSPEPGREQPRSDDPAALRADTERVRRELADTVDALAAKADVKAQAQQAAQDVKQRAQETRGQVLAQAEDLLRHAQRTAKDKPVVPIAAGGLLALVVLRGAGRRRRRRKQRRREAKAKVQAS